MQFNHIIMCIYVKYVFHEFSLLLAIGYKNKFILGRGAKLTPAQRIRQDRVSQPNDNEVGT